MAGPAAIASVRNLRLKYPGDAGLLFRGLSLTISRGEKVLLLGPSGCGKSTLLQVLSGLIPDAVEVPLKCDGLDIPDRWGYVFQDPDTQFCLPYVDEELAFTLENLRTPPQDMPRLIQFYLRQVGLWLDDAHAPIRTLSQGMKQRLAIACALALDPEVLFLDEPSALLDPEGTKLVWDALKHAAADKTLVIVEHQIDEIVDWVDRIVVLSAAGEVIADGDHGAVFQDCRERLKEYGVWYPGVWQGYRDRSDMPSPARGMNAADHWEPVLEISRFEGLYAGVPRIDIEHARVFPGEWICLIGANGAGKSTLLSAIMRLIRTQGVCRLANEQVCNVEHAVRHAAYVFQNPEFQFVTNTVEDEAAYSLRYSAMSAEERRATVDDVLRRFDLLSCREQHPFQLSMGQKRRLSVASAVVRRPGVLLLDEPTFGQDARNTFSLLDCLEQLRAEGTAIIMATHDMEIVRRCSTRVWKIAAGRIVQDASPELCHVFQARLPAEEADAG